MQNDSTSIEKTLGAILGPSWSNGCDAAVIAAFESDLLDMQFFPLPKRVRSLGSRAALMHYEHLRPPVRQQLTDEIKALWAKHLEYSPQTTPIAPSEPPAPASTSDTQAPRIEDTRNAERQTPTPDSPPPAIAQKRFEGSPFTGSTPPRRDLFDLVLDFVAATIGLFR